MPRPGLPPTPGSSTDLKAKDGVNQLASLHLAFELPPPAIHDAARTSPGKLSPGSSAAHHSQHHQHHHQHMSPPSYPMQAAETVKARRRSSAATRETKDNSSSSNNSSTNTAFALPPPPTRSRKIIQMKPRQDDAAAAADASAAKESTGKPAAGKAAKSAANAGASGSGAAAAGGGGGGAKAGKKQPSATSAAGRKIARKTAHSLIERRRRSKMNEEFAVLKNMIPACTGDMHKLAILQASIEYIRYLEDCVSQLKAQHGSEHRGDVSASGNPLPSIREFHPTFHGEPADVDMSDSEAVSPTFTARRASEDQHNHNHHHYPAPAAPTHQPSVSPALHPQDARPRHHSYSSSSAVPDYRHHGSFTLSATPSPAFGPQRHGPYARSSTSTSASTVTSPALNPQTELDQEATAALLMLNNDRRGTTANARGLSVRDLLSG
ncbi:HLH transcription factor, putative [Cordyceps militaris CM01]|uniref:HLH transcription factor, putative n=2 Tax=Cordyceps militaris TaxID=73501 RepID=G3JLA5_CORMM|nr:HLH transcription factor, putative [Cordyceps militaris CM01]ATY63544.1 Helix-loop-helix DNA-binding [Cordyceps militaris]EGX90479.1 HLH transcription factor, putative [Cordyceps militaris CM01]